MVTRSQKIRVIIFISIISAILIYTLFVLVGEKLLTKTDDYYIKLKKQSVQGLSVGQDVRYYGITIGKITDIAINKKDISEIIVTISVNEDTPIKETVRANLAMVGITGLKVIELVGGKNEDKDLPPNSPNSFIEANPDLFSNITGKAEIIAEKVELLLNNLLVLTNSENREHISNIITNLDDTIENLEKTTDEINLILGDNRENIQLLIVSTKETVGSVERIVKKLESQLEGDELKNILAKTENIADQIDKEIVPSINRLSEKVELTVNHLDRTLLSGRKDILKSLDLLKETLENLKEFSLLIRDNPDILIRGAD